MNVKPVLKNPITKPLCILTSILVVGSGALISNCNKKHMDLSEYDAYQKALSDYNKARINYENYSIDSVSIKEHLEGLYDMKAHYRDILKEDIKDFDLLSEEELSKIDGTYDALNQAIKRSERDVDIATGKELNQAKARYKHVVDSLVLEYAKH